MIITFSGHSTISDREGLAVTVKKVILENTRSDENIIFYCGGYGDFDSLCAGVCREVKNSRPGCTVVLITPYITESGQRKIKALMATGLYDQVIYPPLERVPPRFAISRRNEWMVGAADLIIAYVVHPWGGAHNTVEYARRRGKRVINLGGDVTNVASDY